MTDWRALCEELTREVEQYAEDRGDLMPECADRARAALAEEPVAAPAGPSDDDLDLLVIAIQALRPAPDYSRHDLEVVDKGREILRKWLARFGHQPAPVPVAWMYRGEPDFDGREWQERWRVTMSQQVAKYKAQPDKPIPLFRAQAAPVPVPVAERLPGPGDCDAEGRCWLHLPDMGTEPLWRLTDPSMRSRYHSHWLPATALPLPQGEVEE